MCGIFAILNNPENIDNKEIHKNFETLNQKTYKFLMCFMVTCRKCDRGLKFA